MKFENIFKNISLSHEYPISHVWHFVPSKVINALKKNIFVCYLFYLFFAVIKVGVIEVFFLNVKYGI